MSAGLNIAALARRTGVAPDTLRKWEQRYGILRPQRTAGGQRRYTERDVARVLWLRARLDEGYRIGEAAALLGPTRGSEPTKPEEQVEAVLDAAERGDAAQVGAILDQVFALGEAEGVLETVIRPLVWRVGEDWAAGRLGVAEEHLISEAVRARLAQLVADASGGVRGTAVLACGPGERHELGLMMAAAALRGDGWQVIYLGADTPVATALHLCALASARVLGFSIARTTAADDLERELAAGPALDGVQVVIGGPAASKELATRMGARYANSDLPRTVKALRSLGS